MVKGFRIDIHDGDMDISRLIIYAQHIKVEKIKEM